MRRNYGALSSGGQPDTPDHGSRLAPLGMEYSNSVQYYEDNQSHNNMKNVIDQNAQI